MISFLQEHKVWVVIAGLIALVAINWDKISFVVGYFKRTPAAASPNDRRSLYDNLMSLQTLLVKCGVDRKDLDTMTLSEVGVVATTGNYDKNENTE